MSSILKTCILQKVLLREFKDEQLIGRTKTLARHTSKKGLGFDIHEEPLRQQ